MVGENACAEGGAILQSDEQTWLKLAFCPTHANKRLLVLSKSFRPGSGLERGDCLASRPSSRRLSLVSCDDRLHKVSPHPLLPLAWVHVHLRSAEADEHGVQCAASLVMLCTCCACHLSAMQVTDTSEALAQLHVQLLTVRADCLAASERCGELQSHAADSAYAAEEAHAALLGGLDQAPAAEAAEAAAEASR